MRASGSCFRKVASLNAIRKVAASGAALIFIITTCAIGCVMHYGAIPSGGAK